MRMRIGVVTYHWSVRQNRDTPLNFTHEYVAVSHETANAGGNHFQLVAGLIIGKENRYPALNWKVLDRTKHIIFQTPILFTNDWENFAITLNYNKRTIQVFYSTGQNHLSAVTAIEDNTKDNYSPKDNLNPNDEGGLFQFGLLRKSTGAKDARGNGYQGPQFREGLTYGSIFVENSANGCVSR